MKEVKFETALKRLEEIVQKLESEETDLDQSIKVFEEGNKLVKLCLKKLENAEQKVKHIVIEND